MVLQPHRVGDQARYVGQAEHVGGVRERLGGDERHPDQPVVERERMPEEPVLAEVLAVVGRDDDDRLIEHAGTVQRIEHASRASRP